MAATITSVIIMVIIALVVGLGAYVILSGDDKSSDKSHVRNRKHVHHHP
jgi:hypothetical protein